MKKLAPYRFKLIYKGNILSHFTVRAKNLTDAKEYARGHAANDLEVEYSK